MSIAETANNPNTVRGLTHSQASVSPIKKPLSPNKETVKKSRGLVCATEVAGGEIGFLLQRPLPTVASFVLLAEPLEHVAQVQQRLGELIALLQGFAIQVLGVAQLTRFLQQQAGVVEQFRAALALFD